MGVCRSLPSEAASFQISRLIYRRIRVLSGGVHQLLRSALMIYRVIRNRGRLNVTFWLLWGTGGVLATVIWHVKLDFVVSVLLGSAALWVNLYPRFFQGPNVTCLVNQITILELPVGNQTALVIDIAIEDLLSIDPTPQARQLIASNGIVRDAVASNSADALR